MGLSNPNKPYRSVVCYRNSLIILLLLTYAVTTFASIRYYEYKGYVLGMHRELEIMEKYNTCVACDITFHTRRAETWDFARIICNADEFYAPGLHVFMGLVYRILGLEINLVYILFSNLITVVLIPIAIYALAGIFLNGGRRLLAVMFYLFCTRLPLLFVGWGTIAHALGIFFSLISIKYMYDYLTNGYKKDYYNTILTTMLVVLSHQGAGVYHMGVFTAFLFLAKKYKTILMLVCIIIVLSLIYPAYVQRPIGYIGGGVFDARYGIWGITKRLVFKDWVMWIHPIIALWFFYGIPPEFGRGRKLFWIAFIAPILLFWSDINGRSVMHSIPLACIIAARGFRWPHHHKILFVVVLGVGMLIQLRGALVFGIPN